MADNTSIEWTDATWTPIRARWFEIQSDGGSRERVGWHCEHLSEGCRNCYAEGINRRLGTGLPFRPAHLKHKTALGDTRGDVTVVLDQKMLGQPQRWRRARDIFVCSMTDLFAAFVSDEIIDQVFAAMREAPWHRYQVLTKRAARMRAYMTTPGREARIRRAAEALAERDVIRLLDDPCTGWPLPHVIMMVSAETQREADERIPELLATPAALRGLSLEPLLGPIDLTCDGLVCEPCPSCAGASADPDTGAVEHCRRCEWTGKSDEWGIDWVIVGGESGPHARPMHPDWARNLRDQCAAASMPFFFKQWGEWRPPAEGEEFDTSMGRAQKVPAFIVAPAGTVCCFENGEWTRGGEPMLRVGKKAAGRLLDGVEHNGLPEASPCA